MIRKIVLENYMAHAKTVIEPAAGLTVLTGPNNCGKSAVVSALQTLCHNEAGDYMVRHGEKDCRVIVETDAGHTIEWRRKGRTVSYVIDGEEHHRLGRGVPDALDDVLRLPKVEAEGGVAFDVHFGEQKSPIFLLDEPGSRAATFFASSSDAVKLMEMQRRHRTKFQTRQRDEGRLAGEAQRLECLLETLAPVEAIEEAVERAETEHRQLSDVADQIAVLAKAIAELSAQARRLAFREAMAGALEPLAPPPALADVAALETLAGSIHDAMANITALEARLRSLDALVVPPEMADVGPLSELIGSIADATADAETRSLAAAAAGALNPPPDLADVAPLTALIAEIEGAEGRAADQEKTIAKVEKDLAAVKRDIMRWAEAHPTCPTCGAPVDADRLIAEAHIHD